MFIPRRFPLRFTVALMSMAVFFAALMVTIGWMTVKHEDWLVRVIGSKREKQVAVWYIHWAAALVPADSDGDGYSDGAEIMCETDPHIATDHRDWGVDALGNRRPVGYCGEELQVRFVTWTNEDPIRLPRGFQAYVTADYPALLAKGQKGIPTMGPILATTNPSGELEVNMMVTAPVNPVSLKIGNAATGERFGECEIRFFGWRGQPVQPEFSDAGNEEGDHWKSLPPPPIPKRQRILGTNVLISFPDAVAGAVCYVVERKSLTPGAQWEAAEIMTAGKKPDPTSWFSWSLPDEYLRNSEFRVIPALKSPP